MMPKYPIYVISKGRSDTALTAKFLMKDRVPFRIVVEPQEREQYEAVVGVDRVLVLPFSNLGLGSIPARNWVWEHSKEEGHKRHWILDDNIIKVFRRYNAIKIPCESGAAIEDFVERYENIAIAGMNYEMFAPNCQKLSPLVRNVHVYSNLLILNSLPLRWRGRYNEDTDLCLQVLSSGWCTILFNAFLIFKVKSMKMKGGNTDELYKGDGRLKMARSLAKAWPGVVDVKRRFRRPQHVIRRTWAQFDTPLKRRTDIDWSKLDGTNEYGMECIQVKPTIQSDVIRSMLSPKIPHDTRA